MTNAVRVLFIIGLIGSFTSPALTNISLALAVIALLAVPSEWGRLARAARQPLGIGALALLGVMAAAMLWADVDWKHRFDAWWHWRTLLLVVIGVAIFDETRWKERGCLTVVGVLSVVNVVSLVMWYRGIETLGDPGIILRNHVAQGMAFTMGALFAIVLGLTGPYRLRTRRLLLLAGALFIANVAVVSTGRSGQIALLVCATVGAFALIRSRWRWLTLIAVPVASATLLWASPMVREHFEQVFEHVAVTTTAPSMNGTELRQVIWRTTVDLIKRKPWFGYGVGAFPPTYAREVRQHYAGWQAMEVEDTHNQYLRIAVEAGMLGTIAFFGFIVGAVYQNATQPYRACGLALLSAWLVTSFFSSHFETFVEGHMIALGLGMLLASDAGRRAAPEKSKTTLAISPESGRAEFAKPPSERSFGLQFSLILAGIGGLGFFKGWGAQTIALFFTFSLILALVTFFVPRVLAPCNRAWFKLGQTLGRIVNPIVLGIIFFVVLTPFAIIARRLGRDELRLKRRKVDSYWVNRVPAGPAGESLKNQF